MKLEITEKDLGTLKCARLEVRKAHERSLEYNSGYAYGDLYPKRKDILLRLDELISRADKACGNSTTR